MPMYSTDESRAPKRLLSLTVVLCSLVLLTLAASGGAVAQEVDISLQPQETDVGASENTTISVVVEGAESGVGAYNMEIGTTNSAVTITNATLTEEPAIPNTQIAEGGSAVILTAAMGLPENAHQPAEEITIAELTVTGQTVGESTELFFGPGPEIGPIDTSSGGYTVSGLSNTSVTVVEEDSNGDTDDSGTNGGDSDTNGNVSDTDDDDGSGPGIGIAGALVALLGAVVVSRWR